jgi:protein O-GlcNAc transferase
MVIDATMTAAGERHRAGQLLEAETLYRRILQVQPDHADALHLLGLVVSRAGRPAEAIELVRRAIAVNPSAADYWIDLGIILDPLGRWDEAIGAYRQAIALRPGSPEAHNNLGNALAARGRLDEALAALTTALSLRPDYADALYNLGNIHQRIGNLKGAAECLSRSTILRPDWAPAHNNLGSALCELGRLDEGITAYRHALALCPTEAGIHENLGEAYHGKGEVDAAIACFEAALKLRPNSVSALNSLGNACKNRGEIARAIDCYERALSADPDFELADANRLLALTLHPDCDPSAMLREQKLWEQRHARRFFKETARPYANDRAADRRLRVGYVSADFRDHVVGRNVLPILRERDRAQFEVFCYSNVNRPDAMTDRFRSLSDGWRNIARLDNRSAADLVRADEIDILVDLSLHTGGNRLLIFARKPAPVQVTFAGYPGGTGLSTIDWRLTDPYLDPPGVTDGDYVERSYRLAHSFWCYDPQAMGWESGTGAVPPEVGPLPALKNGFITFGNLSNFCKVHDGVLALWARVLREVDCSRMLVMAPPGRCRTRVLDAMTHFGVERGRVEFTVYQPRGSYLSTFNRVDLGLDTSPYNGHTASLDSYWMGVPVISRLGRTVFGRAGLSQLTNLGLSELVARDDEEFVKIAAEWAGDVRRLAELRRGLRQRLLDSPLGDAHRFTRNIESAYRAMWKAWI